MSRLEVPRALRKMLRDASRFSAIAFLIVIAATFAKPGPGRILSSLLSLATVAIYFLASVLLFRFKGTSAITFLALVQAAYFLKLILVAITLILVFKFFGDNLDRQWFGAATILMAAAWLGGEIRGFFRIRYIFDSNSE